MNCSVSLAKKRHTHFRDTWTAVYPWPRKDTHTLQGYMNYSVSLAKERHTLQGYMNCSVFLAKKRHTHFRDTRPAVYPWPRKDTHFRDTWTAVYSWPRNDTHTSGIHELQCIPGQGKTHTSGIHELQCIPGQETTHTLQGYTNYSVSLAKERHTHTLQGYTNYRSLAKERHTHTSGIHELQCIPGHFSQHVGGQGPSTDGRTRGTLPSLTTGTDCVGDMAPRPEVRHNLVCTSGATWQLVFGSNMQNMREIPVKWTRQSAEVPYDRHQQIKPVSLYITPDRLGFFPRSGWRAGWEGGGY